MAKVFGKVTNVPEIRLLVVIVAVLLLAWGCSGNQSNKHSGKHTTAVTGAAVTLKNSSPPSTTGTTGTTGGTSGVVTTKSRGQSVTLRVEGDRGTRFSGICSADGQQTVISGQVPKLFNYNLSGQKISCRIQKQSGNGDLRVILLANGTTKSVQQTNAPKGTINVTYSAR